MNQDGWLLKITDVTINASDPLDTKPGFGWENFTCTVTDDSEVDAVQLDLTYPDSHLEHIPMNTDGDTYYYNVTLTDSGGIYTQGYIFNIWADDTSGNFAESAFDMPLNEDVDINGKVHFMDMIEISGHYNECWKGE